MVLIYSLKFNLVSRNISIAIFDGENGQQGFGWKTTECDSFFWDFRGKINYWACLFGSILKFISHWNIYSRIFLKSVFKSIPDPLWFLTTDKSKVSATNSLKFDHTLCVFYEIYEVNLRVQSECKIGRKYGPEKLQTQTLFTQCELSPRW